MYQILTETKNHKLLKDISDDARSLSTSRVAQTLRGDDDGVQSIIGDEEFPFDHVLVNTAAYRRTLVAAHRKLNKGKGRAEPIAAHDGSNSESNIVIASQDADQSSFVTARTRILPSIKVGSLYVKSLFRSRNNSEIAHSYRPLSNGTVSHLSAFYLEPLPKEPYEMVTQITPQPVLAETSALTTQSPISTGQHTENEDMIMHAHDNACKW